MTRAIALDAAPPPLQATDAVGSCITQKELVFQNDIAAPIKLCCSRSRNPAAVKGLDEDQDANGLPHGYGDAQQSRFYECALRRSAQYFFRDTDNLFRVAEVI